MAEQTSRREALTRRSYELLTRKLTPEGTRKATTFERLTVGRLSWDRLVAVNRALRLLGWLTYGLLYGFMACALVGLNLKAEAESALNSGRPREGALAIAILVPALLLIALRSSIGFLRWRVQRELWRRDVAELTRTAPRRS
jgi:hypothetical protein